VDDRNVKKREKDPPKDEMACDISTEARIMAASGLWQDLQEGLVQAETLCNDMLEKHRGTARCEQAYRRTIAGQGRYGHSLRATVPGVDLLVWRALPGGACGQGGERT